MAGGGSGVLVSYCRSDGLDVGTATLILVLLPLLLVLRNGLWLKVVFVAVGGGRPIHARRASSVSAAAVWWLLSCWIVCRLVVLDRAQLAALILASCLLDTSAAAASCMLHTAIFTHTPHCDEQTNERTLHYAKLSAL